jgi:hypothetical protein
MFALDLGIGHSVELGTEYQNSRCLAGQDIRAGYSGSISRRLAGRQKMKARDVEV